MTNNKNIRLIFCLAAIASITTFNYPGYTLGAVYNNSSFTAPLDTAAFQANSEQGWSALSSYLHRDSAGSVAFELILKCSQPVNDWLAEQFVGTITQEIYIPAVELQLDYYLLQDNRWEMRITAEGKVYLSVKEGVTPTESPVVLPIKVQYSKQ